MKIKLNKKIMISCISVLLVCVSLLLAFKIAIYRPDFNLSILFNYESKYLNFNNTDKFLFMEPKNNENISTGLIFYPNGLVDEKAYLPLLTELSKQGYGVYILKYPLKMPIFGANGISKKIIKDSRYNKYVLMAHTLGGNALFRYLSKNGEELNKVNALVLLATYNNGKYDFKSNKKIFNDNVLSIVGTKDKILDLKKYEEYKKNLPENTKYLYIDNGNNSYYGNYTNVNKPKDSFISRENQQYFVLNEFKKFMSKFD